MFSAKAKFACGNYVECIQELEKEDSSVERNVQLYRAYAAMGENGFEVGREMSASEKENEDVAAAMALARHSYLRKSGEGERDAGEVEELQARAREQFEGTRGQAQLMYAQMLVSGGTNAAAGHLEAVLRALNGNPELEARVLLLQLYLAMGHVELAERELAAAQNLDADAPETTLAFSWLAVFHYQTASTPHAKAQARVSEAVDLLAELMERWGETAYLYTTTAVCHLALADYSLAEEALVKALDLDPRCSDALANMVVTYRHLSRPPSASQPFLDKLSSIAPKHHFLSLLSPLQMFDELCSS